MTSTKYNIYIRDAVDPVTEEMIILDKLDRFTEFEAVSRNNGIGSFRIAVPDGSPQATLLTQPGRGIVVFPEGETVTPVFSGPILSIERDWDDTNSGMGTLVVSGPDDNWLLASRLAWPVPDQPIGNQHFSSTYKPNYNGDASPDNALETITALIQANMVQPGDTAREVPGISVPLVTDTIDDDDSALGLRVRFSPMDVLVAAIADEFDVRVRFLWMPSDKKINVLVKPATDKTDTIRFGEQFGNLKSFSYGLKAPKATRLIVGGAGQGRYRWFNQYKMGEDPTFVDPFSRTPVEVDWSFSKELYENHSDIGVDATYGYAKDKVTYTLVIDGVTKGPFDSKDPKTGEVQYLSRWRPGSAVPTLPLVTGPYKLPGTGTVARDKLTQISNDWFRNNAPTGKISIGVIDTPQVSYLKDFAVGDIVKVFIDGVGRPEVVREAKLTITERETNKISLVVGEVDSTGSPELYRQIRNLWRTVKGAAFEDDSDTDPFAKLAVDAPTIKVDQTWYINGSDVIIRGVARGPIPGVTPTITSQYSVDGGAWTNMPAAAVTADSGGDNSAWDWIAHRVFNNTGAQDSVRFRVKAQYPSSGLEVDTSDYSIIVKTIVADDPALPSGAPDYYKPTISSPGGSPAYTSKYVGDTLVISGQGWTKQAKNLPTPSTGTEYVRIRVYQGSSSGGVGAFIKEIRARADGKWSMSFKLSSSMFIFPTGKQYKQTGYYPNNTNLTFKINSSTNFDSGNIFWVRAEGAGGVDSGYNQVWVRNKSYKQYTDSVVKEYNS